MKRLSLYLIIVFLILLAGCSKKLTPEESFNAYLESWQNMNFEEMYKSLSQEAKGEISKEDFVARYEKIYQGINAENLKIKGIFKKTEDKPKEATTSLVYSVQMETSAGPLEFTHKATLVKEKNETEQEWFVNWEPSLIFPQLLAGDTVGVKTLKATRGEIRDRNGSGLAINAPANVVGVVPGKLGEQSIEKLASILSIEEEEINSKLSATWVKPELFVPLATLPYGETDIQPYLEIPGVMIQEETVRSYPFGASAAHLVGYVREVTAEQLEKLKEKGYSSGDVVGNSGLESIYEEELRGQDGVHIFIKKEDGSLKETLAEKEVVQGKNLELTIDANLQNELFQQLDGDAGTSVALDPTNGALLALVSTPSFDPNAFVRGLSDEQWEEWNSDPKKPFFNRFVNRNAPGSVFKTITAAIGLKTGITVPNDVKEIDGIRWSKDESWGGYYVTRVKDKASVNLRNAFVYSDNIYFAQEAVEMGVEKFVEEVSAFGFGDELNLPFPVKPSQLANDGIKTEVQLADSAYGQGEVLMSPIHLATIYSALLNEGDMLYPSLLKDEQPKVWKEGLIDHETVHLLKENLRQVVEDPGGSGHGTTISGKAMAGKSGTAEIKASKDDKSGTENGWFVGFDLEQPNLLVAMMVEDVKNRGGSSYVVKKVKNVFLTVE
ncbi:penicillin-binding transpeptidase domain-containing protein [Robertmurraya kyonggiensis]|uniref:serine-type D-Ala-D-Ala carboxypeptidase n=1 Tax=Robertmurraya kyonggiensis TaxID=1037680 RepID=A0A4V5P287_9BACI|nr:penicillin-binding transpeptidase domain-containing protein [Robertmurraya kyonggiensis]TKC19140.1 penicillin-binding transpeptidase domain-containing protein [Robertmurraya kyonggiensis]